MTHGKWSSTFFDILVFCRLFRGALHLQSKDFQSSLRWATDKWQQFQQPVLCCDLVLFNDLVFFAWVTRRHLCLIKQIKDKEFIQEACFVLSSRCSQQLHRLSWAKMLQSQILSMNVSVWCTHACRNSQTWTANLSRLFQESAHTKFTIIYLQHRFYNSAVLCKES